MRTTVLTRLRTLSIVSTGTTARNQPCSFLLPALNPMASASNHSIPLPRLLRDLLSAGYPETQVESLRDSALLTTEQLSRPLESQNENTQEIILSFLSSMDNNQLGEPVSSLLASPVRAIFAYGTLRPDWSERGDKWGATKGCTWTHATVDNFVLFQNPSLNYPFAVPCASPAQSSSSSSSLPDDEGKDGFQNKNAPPPSSTLADLLPRPNKPLYGTLMTWPEDDASFAAAVQRCNDIEGWDHKTGGGLYRRAIVHAVPIPSTGSAKGGKNVDSTTVQQDTVKATYGKDSKAMESGAKPAEHEAESAGDTSVRTKEGEGISKSKNASRPVPCYIYFQDPLSNEVTKTLPRAIRDAYFFPEGDWLGSEYVTIEKWLKRHGK